MLVLSIAVLVLVIDTQRILEHGDEARPINDTYQMRSRRIRSKGVRRQVDLGQTGILSWLPRFDYDYEHRFTEHEKTNCV